MGKTSTGPIALATMVKQGRSFLEAAKQYVDRAISASPSLQLRRPELIEGELGLIFTDLEVKHHATLNRTRASGARICVEIDLLADVVECFPIIIGSKTLCQRVKYEKFSFYCKKCKRQGHTEAVCRVGQQFHEKQKRKKIVTIGQEKNEWRKKSGDVGSSVEIEKQYVQVGGVLTKLFASVFTGIVHEQGSDKTEKVGESSRGIKLIVDNDKEKMEIELGRDRNMDEDGTVASKTCGIKIAEHRGGTH
ncbi:unnamed protein product [Fraxinus pennsylvanica]|uniref:DUF4283 domain-containing protein n=1 Tax=Fraxinus pennsylvanica TaxID=56036 RepID=A0AAD2DK21_9LAMI|nr:unnamed protein product [Fraxinus pennsylvanica]